MEQQTHRELMALRGNPDASSVKPDCSGVCVPVYSAGVWTLYRCRDCQAEIAAYGGQADARNYVLKGRRA